MESLNIISTLLSEIGPQRSQITETAYDTSWIAQLGELDPELSAHAIEWLREHQLPDGSWGAPRPHYHHDRLICTLGALTALTRLEHPCDQTRIERGRQSLEPELRNLPNDPCGETIGFEVLVPPLLLSAGALETLQKVQTDKRDILAHIIRKRSAKLATLPRNMINRFITVAHSAEMAGLDGQHLLDIDNLQEVNGSIGHSPSATAYFTLYTRYGNLPALQYLQKTVRRLASGGAPVIAPTDVFETTWVLYNLTLAGPLEPQYQPRYRELLDFLYRTWAPGLGIPQASQYTPRDSDDSGLVYTLLTPHGYTLDIEALFHYESPGHFRCFVVESNPSISANVHVLNALRIAGYPLSHPTVQKILRFLERTRTPRPFWFDKWHTSPYYPTSHTIITCTGYDNNFIQSSINWLLETQRPEGAWGYYMPTAEETAYVLQALFTWKRAGNSVPPDVLHRGVNWLAQHQNGAYPPLWIGKALYCPIYVVQSAIAGTLRMAEIEGIKSAKGVTLSNATPSLSHPRN